MRVAGGLDVLRPQRTHVQPHGRAARSAVVEERNWPVLGLRARFEIRHVKHMRHRLRVGRILWRRERKLRSGQRLAVGTKLRVLRVGGADGDGARNRRVGDVLPAHVDRPLRCGVRGSRRFGCCCGRLLLRCRFLSGLIFLCADGNRKNQRGRPQQDGKTTAE